MVKNSIVLEGKDYDKLIEEGIMTLNTERDLVEIEVLEQGKSIMGVSIKNFKIRMTLKESVEDVKDEYSQNMMNKGENAGEQIQNDNNSDDYFKFEFLDDGVYILIVNYEKFKLNLEHVLNRIRRKRIKNIDIKSIQNAVNSKGIDKIKIAPQQEEESIDAEMEIEISKDGLKAYMILTPPDGGKELDFDTVMDNINKELSFGIDTIMIKKIIDKKIYNRKILIAKGKTPIDGKDGYIKYYFSKDVNATPKELEDGSVDFRNLNLINNVKKGDVLAELVEPTNGENGITVKGESIEFKKGKSAFFKYGKNTAVSPEGKYLMAEKDGQVRAIKGKIAVYEVYDVKGDVDNSTGNIQFNGTVKISGNVLTGFEVSADGDIEVKGVVEGANILSKGDVTLHRGVQGHSKGRIISAGSVIAKYIENTYIEAQKDVVSEAIMHSKIVSKGSIKATGRKGLIVGGTCSAFSEISAKIIGSSMSTVTILEVGIDPGYRNKEEEIRKKIDDTRMNIEKLSKTITFLNRISRTEGLSEDKQIMLNKAIETRKVLMTSLGELQSELEFIETQIKLLSNGKVKVQEVIYPGVKIVIGNCVMFVRDEIKHCTIYKEDNELRIGPYEL